MKKNKQFNKNIVSLFVVVTVLVVLFGVWLLNVTGALSSNQ